MGRLERLVWVGKNYFLIIGVAACFLIPFSVDLLLLLHRYSFLIPLALWICKKKEEVTGRNAAAVVPQAALAPMASSVANLFDFLFFKPQEEEQSLRGFEMDEPSAALQGPAWWLSQPVLAPAGAVGKEAAQELEFLQSGVLDSTAWKRADVSPSAPPISSAYSTSFFPFDDCKAEGGWEHNKSMEETWEAICLMKEEKGRRRRVKDASGRRTREVPAVKEDELFRGMDALIEKQRHLFEFDFRREQSPVQRRHRAAELDRPPPAPLAVTQTRRAIELDRPPAAPLAVTHAPRIWTDAGNFLESLPVIQRCI